MSDEAVVRIVLDDGGGVNPPPTSQPAPTPPAPAVVDTTGLAGLGKGMAQAIMGNLYDGLFDALKEGKDKFAGVRDPILAKAKDFFDQGLINSAKDLRNLVQAGFDPALAGLTAAKSEQPPPSTVAPPNPQAPLVAPSTTTTTPPPAPTPPLPPAPTDQGAELPGDSGTGISDPATFASPRTLERLARETKQKEYLELAKKRVEREETLAAIDAEYAKLKPPPLPKPNPPFDPVALARKRVEAENQRAAVDAEYAKLKPKAEKSTFDAVLEVAEDFRGIIGGTFGRVAGVVLDITARLRDARNKAASASVPVDAPTATVAPPIPSAVLAPEGGTPGPVAALAPPIPAAVPTGGTGDTSGAAAATAELAQSSESAAQGMAAIVPVAGAVAVGFMAVVGAFNAFMNEANKMATKAAEYNPEVAQAQAQAEIRGIMGDMRRARENSKELTDLVRAQSEMQQRWEDIKASVMNKIIPVLTGVLEVLSSLLGVASKTDVYDKDDLDPTSIILKNSSLFDATDF